MRTAVCLLLAGLYALMAAVFSGAVFDVDTSIPMKVGFGITALAVWCAAGLLALRALLHLPSAAEAAFRGWCIAHPVVYFIASLDRGMISGQELLLGVFVASFSWATWKAFIWAKPSRCPTEQVNA